MALRRELRFLLLRELPVELLAEVDDKDDVGDGSLDCRRMERFMASFGRNIELCICECTSQELHHRLKPEL